MTARIFTEDTLLIASHNKDKIIEIKTLLSPYVKNFPTASDHNLPEPDEDGKTFHENARIKALTAAAATRIPALADDSGLCVAGLNGAPGIFSSRWAMTGHEGGKDFDGATKRIFKDLNGKDAAAEFVCVLALAWPDGTVVYAEGKCAGTLVYPGRGDYKFGYDPYFTPNAFNQTFAELGQAVKAKISHRALAFKALVKSSFAKSEK